MLDHLPLVIEPCLRPSPVSVQLHQQRDRRRGVLPLGLLPLHLALPGRRRHRRVRRDGVHLGLVQIRLDPPRDDWVSRTFEVVEMIAPFSRLPLIHAALGPLRSLYTIPS